MNNNTTAIILCVIVAVAFIAVAAASYETYRYNNELKSTTYSNFKEHCRMVKLYCNETVFAINHGNKGSAILYAGALYELASAYHYDGIDMLGSDYFRAYVMLYEALPSIQINMRVIHTSLVNGSVTPDQIKFLDDCDRTFYHIFLNTPEPDWTGYHITHLDEIIVELGKLID